MPSRVPHRARLRGGGFTLVELLIGLVITALVAAVLVALYGTATRTVFDQQARARGPHAAARALDQLADDLGRALLTVATTNELLVLTGGGTNQAPGVTASLSFSTLDPIPEGDLPWSTGRRVAYRVEQEGALAGHLVRIHQPLSGPGSLDGAETNVLVRNVDLFTVELFDGSAWQAEWQGNVRDPRRPQLARVVIGSPAWRGETPTQRADLFIPSGLSVTSSLIRQGRSAAN